MPPGAEIGGYRVLGPLGHGGMGAVYRAVDGDGSLVALKVLHPHLSADPDARERLRREVRTLQRIRHPGVARVLDAEIDSTDAFVVTELVEGLDLAARVRSGGPLGAVELADLAERLRAALAVVHETGVLHRDLTPGNVLVTERGPVLIDFGIAQAAEDLRVTSTGLVMGTPGYLSPELLEGAEPSAAGDWWGWAALLAFAATGREPFGGPPLQAVLARARAGEVDLAGLDRRTAAALRSALAVDQARRAEPTAVVAELRRAAQGDTEVGDDEPTESLTTDLIRETARTRLVGSDGLTRPVPAAGAADGLEDGYDDGSENGFDEGDRYGAAGDGADDLGADPDRADLEEEPDGPGVPPVPEPRRRVGTVLALGAVLVAAGTVRPGVALATAVVLVLLVRSIGLDVSALHQRRARRGRGRVDAAGAVVGWPWYLLRAALGIVPAVLVAASVVVVVGGVGWWLLDGGRWVLAAPGPGEAPGELAGNATWVTWALLGAAVLAGLLVLWFGPMSRATRVGARWTLAAVAPGWVGAITLVVLCLAAAAVLLSLTSAEPGVVWWPLPGPPDLG